MLEKYKAQSIHYVENALNAMAAGEAEKAGEFLWGSMAEALKAVAASRGSQLRSHGDVWDYARQLAKELDDRSIFDAFHQAHSLHSNFYEGGLRLEDVRFFAEDIRKAVGKLLRLAEEGASNR